jgi:hypothetical protein
MLVAGVAVFDGIVHSLGHGNHDVAVDVIVEVKSLFSVVNKAFDHSYVLG